MQQSLLFPLLLAGLASTCAAQQATSTLPPAVVGTVGDIPVVTTPPTSTVAGLTAFESKALLAVSITGNIPAVTMQGTVNRIAGSLKETGSITLKADGAGSENESWTLSSGDRAFSKGAFTGTRNCSATIGGKDLSLKLDQGCERVVPWFGPWNALAAIGTQDASASTATSSADTTAGDVRLRFVPTYGDLSKLSTKRLQSVAEIMQLSAVDVLFDEVTALPKRVEYQQQTTGDPAAAVSVAVAFSDYRLDGGLVIPHHIQRYLQRTLEADIHITSVVTQ